LNPVEVIPNPVDLDDWPLESYKHGYLLWIGRMAEVKGPHRAITAAGRAGLPLVLAGPIQTGQRKFFESKIAPRLDGRRVFYVGEVGGDAKKMLFARATALLMPIRWPEPFGMVMVEALACGTPVIAFPDGAACEVVEHGRNGFLVADEDEMAQAVDQLAYIDARACRDSVSSRYAVGMVAARYEELYRRVRRSGCRSGEYGRDQEPSEPIANAGAVRASRAVRRALGRAHAGDRRGDLRNEVGGGDVDKVVRGEWR
jgi:glycosyltransferase involved in cell wall biosynthesis